MKIYKRVCTIKECGRPAYSGKWFCNAHLRDRTRPVEDIRCIHGKSSDPEYAVWGAMIQRCRNIKNRNYEYYGGRGIEVCDAWGKFQNFYADMGPRPSKLYSLERDNVGGDYEPSNCRWATMREQMINRRMSRNNTSGYRGVCAGKRNGPNKWIATVTYDNRRIHIGTFDDVEVAAWYRDQYAIGIYGEEAPLNFEYK